MSYTFHIYPSPDELLSLSSSLILELWSTCSSFSTSLQQQYQHIHQILKQSHGIPHVEYSKEDEQSLHLILSSIHHVIDTIVNTLNSSHNDDVENLVSVFQSLTKFFLLCRNLCIIPSIQHHLRHHFIHRYPSFIVSLVAHVSYHHQIHSLIKAIIQCMINAITLNERQQHDNNISQSQHLQSEEWNWKDPKYTAFWNLINHEDCSYFPTLFSSLLYKSLLSQQISHHINLQQQQDLSLLYSSHAYILSSLISQYTRLLKEEVAECIDDERHHEHKHTHNTSFSSLIFQFDIPHAYTWLAEILFMSMTGTSNCIEQLWHRIQTNDDSNFHDEWCTIIRLLEYKIEKLNQNENHSFNDNALSIDDETISHRLFTNIRALLSTLTPTSSSATKPASPATRAPLTVNSPSHTQPQSQTTQVTSPLPSSSSRTPRYNVTPQHHDHAPIVGTSPSFSNHATSSAPHSTDKDIITVSRPNSASRPSSASYSSDVDELGLPRRRDSLPSAVDQDDDEHDDDAPPWRSVLHGKQNHLPASRLHPASLPSSTHRFQQQAPTPLQIPFDNASTVSKQNISSNMNTGANIIPAAPLSSAASIPELDVEADLDGYLEQLNQPIRNRVLVNHPSQDRTSVVVGDAVMTNHHTVPSSRVAQSTQPLDSTLEFSLIHPSPSKSPLYTTFDHELDDTIIQSTQSSLPTKTTVSSVPKKVYVDEAEQVMAELEQEMAEMRQQRLAAKANNAAHHNNPITAATTTITNAGLVPSTKLPIAPSESLTDSGLFESSNDDEATFSPPRYVPTARSLPPTSQRLSRNNNNTAMVTDTSRHPMSAGHVAKKPSGYRTLSQPVEEEDDHDEVAAGHVVDGDEEYGASFSGSADFGTDDPFLP